MKIRYLIRIIGYLLVFGGIMRLFANRYIFDLFFMNELWVDHDYFIYIYRILGSFVIFTGLLLITISYNLARYKPLLILASLGFFLIATVMLITALTINIHKLFLIPDFVFSYILSFLFWYTWKKIPVSNP